MVRIKLTTFMCLLSCNLGALTSCNTHVLSSPVMVLLYLHIYLFITASTETRLRLNMFHCEIKFYYFEHLLVEIVEIDTNRVDSEQEQRFLSLNLMFMGSCILDQLQ
jgi:hypothetical protein